MGMKNCLNHPNAAAVTMCNQCHKPICQSCTMVTSMGRFCSSECSIINRETKTKLQGSGGSKGGGATRGLLMIILLLVIGMGGIHFAKKKYPQLAKYDLIGRLMGAKP